MQYKRRGALYDIQYTYMHMYIAHCTLYIVDYSTMYCISYGVQRTAYTVQRVNVRTHCEL